MNVLLRLLVLCICAERHKIYGELVAGFTKCLDFFYEGTPPILPFNDQDLDLMDICQTLKSESQTLNSHFATKYSRAMRIPLYSAYQLPEPEQKQVQMDGTIKNIQCQNRQSIISPSTWFVEKQVKCV